MFSKFQFWVQKNVLFQVCKNSLFSRVLWTDNFCIHLKFTRVSRLSLNIKRHMYISYTTYNLSKKIKWHIIFLTRHIIFFEINQHIIVLYNIQFFYTTYQYHWLFIICCSISKQHIYVGVTSLYVTLFSSNICMLVIYLFYVTQQTYICYCSPSHMLFKKSQNTHMFFSLVCCTSGPMSSLRHGIQVHSVTMGSYKF